MLLDFKKLDFVFGLVLSLVAIYFVISTGVGIYHNYSAVPFWDMWNGYLAFYYQTAEQGWQAWWAQHNEHRLVLAKVFFWLDMEFFQGRMILLFALNFVFSAATFFTFAIVSRGLTDTEDFSRLLLLILAALFAFSWLQEENYVWAFQSQFHMAYLLPLWSLLLLSRYAATHRPGLFVAAAVFGTLSVITMANGLFTLPAMVALALFLRLPAKRIATLCLLSIFSYVVYFWTFSSGSGVPLVAEGLSQRLITSMLYALRYLSGPFYQVLNDWPALQELAGGLFFLLWLCALFATLHIRYLHPKYFTLQAGLLTFALLIAGTASITALGRSQISFYIPSRYMTPALLGWLAILVVLLSGYIRQRQGKLVMGLTTLFFAILLLPAQQQALQEKPFRVFEFKSAAVAAAMGIMDPPVLGRVSYDHEALFKVSELAKRDHKSFFTQDYVKVIPGKELMNLPEAPACRYLQEQTVILPDALDYVRVHGWAYAPGVEATPEYLYFVTDGKAVGYAVTGKQRTDVANAVHANASHSGLQGYLLSSAAGGPFDIYGFNAEHQVICSLSRFRPPQEHQIQFAEPLPYALSIRSSGFGAGDSYVKNPSGHLALTRGLSLVGVSASGQLTLVRAVDSCANQGQEPENTASFAADMHEHDGQFAAFVIAVHDAGFCGEPLRLLTSLFGDTTLGKWQDLAFRGPYVAILSARGELYEFLGDPETALVIDTP